MKIQSTGIKNGSALIEPLSGQVKSHARANPLLLLAVFITLISGQSATLKAANTENSEKEQPVNVVPSSVNTSAKHCVNSIEIRLEHLFMKEQWQKHAELKTKAKWAESVQKRYGSVYTHWSDAKNKKYECRRIGFGNDKEGNVGTSVICLIAAEPCVSLLKK